jgi:hypothetical protein
MLFKGAFRLGKVVDISSLLFYRCETLPVLSENNPKQMLNLKQPVVSGCFDLYINEFYWERDRTKDTSCQICSSLKASPQGGMAELKGSLMPPSVIRHTR